MHVTRDILPARYRSPVAIGQGGMGEIYRATDDVLGRAVAVKVLAERYALDDALRGRFTREALTAARLSGEPNTVTIFDVGEHGGRPFIVMEYLSGGSLETRIREDRVPFGQALDWLEQAARALDAAHRSGVVHRDVKPGNLMLSRDGGLHVTDFGIASVTGLDPMTQTGTILGTAGYLSPEQARGEPASPASDRYALGVVAFELLAGSRPFQAESTTAEATAHAAAPVPSASGRNPALPRDVDRVFERALAKDPSARYASCAELVADLRAAFAAGTERTAVLAAPRPARSRRRAPWAVALLAGLALAGIALAVAATRDGGGPQGVVVRTVVRTVTSSGEPQVRTVTRAAAPSTAGRSGAALNDEGFRLMQAGDYRRARPLLEQAVAKLAGTGSLAEAYASYNLAFTSFALGSCDGVGALLARSEQVQGRRHEIDRLRKQADKACGGERRGNGNGQDGDNG